MYLNKLDEAKEILKKYGQEHLLLGYDKLEENKKEELLNQIFSIDFNLINKLYKDTKKEKNLVENKIEPVEYIDKSKLTKEELDAYSQKGAEIIKNGKFAFVTMAGGQGTRLGHNGPKGTFDLGLKSGKTLFEILCDTLKKAKEEYNVIIPWYIMTSKQNNKETIEFFEEKEFFGYPKSEIRFFVQGEIPMLDIEGNIMLEEDYLVKEAADGHGGLFEAMLKNGILLDMQKRGIEWIYTGGIDNVLSKPVDPICIGVGVKNNVLSVGKSLVKANSKEKVGLFCKKNGKPTVIEYTEFPDELSELADENGELIYGESHVLCNMFHRKVLESIAEKKLPYHIAFKKANYINSKGEKVVGTEPNSYKFETFLFDAFEMLDNMAILRVKREEEFAPVKNVEGVDSPKTARELYKKHFGIVE